MKAVRAEGQEVIEKLLRHSPPRATLLLGIWMVTDIKILFISVSLDHKKTLQTKITWLNPCFGGHSTFSSNNKVVKSQVIYLIRLFVRRLHVYISVKLKHSPKSSFGPLVRFVTVIYFNISRNYTFRCLYFGTFNFGTLNCSL